MRAPRSDKIEPSSAVRRQKRLHKDIELITRYEPLDRSKCGSQPKNENGVARRDRDPLRPVKRKRDRIRVDRATCLKPPAGFSSCRVEREHLPFIRPAKHQAAGSREHTRPGRGMESKLPFQLARLGLEG